MLVYFLFERMDTLLGPIISLSFIVLMCVKGLVEVVME